MGFGPLHLKNFGLVPPFQSSVGPVITTIGFGCTWLLKELMKIDSFHRINYKPGHATSVSEVFLMNKGLKRQHAWMNGWVFQKVHDGQSHR